MTSPSIRIYKIAYDEATMRSVAPPYLLLDNSQGEPHWYELWPILRFLEENNLDDDVWYGFVSPKFPEKANVNYADILRVIERHPDRDVALFTYDWPSLAYWKNPWVSGNRWHPGLVDCMEAFLESRGRRVDLEEVWTDFDTSVFSNYIVAKKRFWTEWRKLAREYLDYVEAGGPELRDNRPTKHRRTEGYRLKTFVQERLATWILTTSSYSVARPNYAFTGSLAPFLDPGMESPRLRILLQGCHLSKKLARQTGMRVFPWLYRKFHRSARRTRNRLRRQPNTPGGVD